MGKNALHIGAWTLIQEVELSELFITCIITESSKMGTLHYCHSCSLSSLQIKLLLLQRQVLQPAFDHITRQSKVASAMAMLTGVFLLCQDLSCRRCSAYLHLVKQLQRGPGSLLEKGLQNFSYRLFAILLNLYWRQLLSLQIGPNIRAFDYEQVHRPCQCTCSMWCTVWSPLEQLQASVAFPTRSYWAFAFAILYTRCFCSELCTRYLTFDSR